MKLINKTDRMKVIPLPHHIYCAALGRCVCMQVAGMKKKVAASLTVPAGGTSKELPDAILCVPQIARLIKQRKLEIEAGAAASIEVEEKKTEKKTRKKTRKKRKGGAETAASSEPLKAQG